MRFYKGFIPAKSWQISKFFNNPAVLKQILRAVLALLFALPAFIFSELIPDVPPIDRKILRVLVTIWFGLMGYGLFPDIAKAITLSFISMFNSLTNRVSTEVMNQILRLPRTSPVIAPLSNHAPIGGVSVNQPTILDTSAIIDGRLLDIAKTGFLFGTALIPNFILNELQQVADSADYLKRARGRRGFEIVAELKKVKGIRVEIWEKEPTGKTADEKLIKLAKNLHGKIFTTDYNLNRIASLSNVSILNVNDLANAVKTLAIPGEKISIKLVHLGKDPKQGVGYLPDGTMVVVEDGASDVGTEVKVEVTRIIQVAAGRMIFTKRVT
ncbi:twitching motility protein PilT [Candidatus Daviesbacteria bacterium]|nr:twitching motility protein PilT [Candidatus Daviesbacteria bacterium]